MPKGLSTPFQSGHEVQYGLSITSRSERTGAVTGATCRFCLTFGREAKPGAKRKRRSTAQVFTMPFRTDNFKRHLTSAHPTAWTEYITLASSEEKEAFFAAAVNHESTLLAHFESTGDINLSINRDIVEVMIGDMLFDADDDTMNCTRSRALSIFNERDDAGPDDNIEVYSVNIKAARRFKMVLGFVAKGASFRAASRFVAVARDVTKCQYLQGASEGVCATYVRVICAASLQAIHELLRECWAYSIALDVGHAQGTSYMDMRVRFCTSSGKLANVHVMALPLFERKTAATQFDAASKALDVVDPDWRTKIVSIGTDGERTMTGRISGVQTRFEQAAKFEVRRIWCGLHQLDLAVQKEYNALHDDSFVNTFTGLIAYLRRQQNLQTEMKTTCPKFVSTRWLSMKRVTMWLANHRVRVVSYLEEKQPSCAPSLSWWILLLCVDSVATVLAATCSRLQGLSTLLSQQEAQLKELVASLSEMCTVTGPHSDASIAALDPTVSARRGSYAVTSEAALAFIRDQGSFVIDALTRLPPNDVSSIALGVANLFAGLYCGIIDVVATRDSGNRGIHDELPPVLPHSLAKIRPVKLSELLRAQRGRLEEAGWSATRIDLIERDHRDLQRAYRSERWLREALDKCSDTSTSFDEGWSLCKGKFGELRQFAGGLASMFPNTATVEADFSLIGGHKTVYRTSLTDFSLEGILHAKQFDLLRSLSGN